MLEADTDHGPELDGAVKAVMMPHASKIAAACLPGGQLTLSAQPVCADDGDRRQGLHR